MALSRRKANISRKVEISVGKKNGIDTCYLLKESYDSLKAQRELMQREYMQTQLVDNYITIETTRIMTEEDRAPYISDHSWINY